MEAAAPHTRLACKALTCECTAEHLLNILSIVTGQGFFQERQGGGGGEIYP